MAEPLLENGENGETPSKKVRRRVGTSPDFMQLAQKRKGKPEVKKSTRSRFFPLRHCLCNQFLLLFQRPPASGYFDPSFLGLIVHCRKPRRR